MRFPLQLGSRKVKSFNRTSKIPPSKQNSSGLKNKSRIAYYIFKYQKRVGACLKNEIEVRNKARPKRGATVVITKTVSRFFGCHNIPASSKCEPVSAKIKTFMYTEGAYISILKEVDGRLTQWHRPSRASSQ